jgi:hypothetical protein
MRIKADKCNIFLQFQDRLKPSLYIKNNKIKTLFYFSNINELKSR